MGRILTILLLSSICFHSIFAQNIGIKLPVGTTPNTTLDINGAVSYREGSPLSIANGVNNNVTLDTMSFYRITAPTANYTITGFTNGQNGRVLVLINATAYTMTLSHLAGTSSAANQIRTAAATNLIIDANGVVTLMYNSNLTKWVVIGVTASNASAFNAWGVTGNSGTTASTNFIGTTDAQDVVIKANSAEISRFTTGGHLGIGTTIPTFKLQIEEPGGYDADIGVRLYNTDNITYLPSIVLQASKGTRTTPTNLTSGYPMGAIYYGGYDGSSFVDIQGASITGRTTQNWTSAAHGSKLEFYTIANGSTTPTQQMNIDQSGYMGIGVTNPSVKLHQDNGTATANYHKFTANGTTGQTASDGFDVGIDASGNGVLNQKEALPLVMSANNAEIMRLTSAGNVLIGGNLTPAEATGVALVNQSSSDLKDDITISTYNTTTTPAFVLFKARGTAASPSSLTNSEELGGFNVNGYAGSSFRGLTSMSTITASDYTTSFGAEIAFRTARNGTSSEHMRITSTGNIGIGVTAPSHILQINGQGRATNSAWATTSDRRLKDIESPFEYGLKELMNINTYRFRYKKDNPLNLPTDKPFQGVIAQELEKIIPEAVQNNPDGYLTVNTDPVFWTMLNSIKELKNENEALKTELELIKNTLLKQNSLNDKLFERLEKMEAFLNLNTKKTNKDIPKTEKK